MIELNCGKCCWMQKVQPPEGTKVDGERGYCTFNPPMVFPMPHQQGKLADLQGQKQVGFLPFMMRPVVKGNEPMCGRFHPNKETIKELDLENEGCDSGSCTQEDCTCD